MFFVSSSLHLDKMDFQRKRLRDDDDDDDGGLLPPPNVVRSDASCFADGRSKRESAKTPILRPSSATRKSFDEKRIGCSTSCQHNELKKSYSFYKRSASRCKWYSRVIAEFLVGAVIGLLISELIKADLPQHCVFHHIPGKWIVIVGQWRYCSRSDWNGVPTFDSTCGYPIPDRNDLHGDVTPPHIKSNFEKTGEFEVELNSQNEVLINGKPVGIWTVASDEGLMMQINAETETLYFAFFKSSIDLHNPLITYTFCSSTLVGWKGPAKAMLQKEDGTWWANDESVGCFYMHRLDIDTRLATNMVPVNRATPLQVRNWKGEPPRIDLVRQKIVEDYLDSKGQLKTEDEVFRTIELVVPNPETEPLLPNKKLDLPGHYIIGYLPSQNVYDPAGLKDISDVYAQLWEFDWSNPKHVYRRLGVMANIIPEVEEQDCGSCYARATSKMLTARLWIKYRKNPNVFGKVTVSAHQATQCNTVNQGCEGGYNYTSLHFAHHNGLRTHECIKESRKLFKDEDASIPDLEKSLQFCHNIGGEVGSFFFECRALPEKRQLPNSCRYKTMVEKWSYIGGVYGAGSADLLMKDLFENGPVAISMEPTIEFSAYKKGIMQVPFKPLRQGDPTIRGHVWEKVDHAVLLVGFGWEKQPDGFILPYWKVQNSWGQRWGEEGFFRYLRGLDYLASEGSAVTASVVLFEDDKPVPLEISDEDEENNKNKNNNHDAHNDDNNHHHNQDNGRSSNSSSGNKKMMEGPEDESKKEEGKKMHNPEDTKKNNKIIMLEGNKIHSDDVVVVESRRRRRE